MKTTIPFKIIKIDDEGFHLLIKVYINKKVAHLLIDTGASKSVFDKNRIKKFVSENKFELHDKLSTGLGSKKMIGHFTTFKKIKIGEMEIKDYTAFLLNLSSINESYEVMGLAPIDGVLGSDILVLKNAIIDYKKQTLKFNYF